MTTCDHIPGGECCNRADLACPQHFTQLLASFTEAVATRDDRAGKIALDLAGHRWVIPAVMTWCAVIQGYAMQPGESRDTVLARIAAKTEALTQALSPQDREEHGPWMFRLGVIVRAAVCGDGDMIEATMATVADDPYMTPERTMSLVASVARAAHDVVASDPRVSAQTMATYAILGSQTLTATGFSMLHPMANLAEAFRLGRMDRTEMATLFADLETSQLLSAVAIAGRALGQLVDPDNVVLIATTGIGATAEANVTGVMEWRDETCDYRRSRQELVAARAMRIACAFATGKRQRVINLLRSSDDDVRYASDVIAGCCSILAMMVASDVTA